MKAPAVVVLLALALGSHQLQTRNYEVVLERVEGQESDPEYFGPRTGMHLRRTGKATSPAIFEVLDIVKPLPNDTTVEAILYERHDNKYSASFIRYRTGLCDYLAKERRPVFSDFRKIFGLPTSCPVQGLYKVDNYRPEDSVLPPFIPGPEHWKLYFALLSGKEYLIKHDLLFSIDRSKAIRVGSGGRG